MQLSLLVLKTSQVERLRDFYQALGFSFQEEKHGNGPIHFSATIQDTVLEIYPLPKSMQQADTTTRLGFRIAKLHETIQHIEEQGGQIISVPKQTEWGYTAIVKDPDGRSVELHQE